MLIDPAFREACGAPAAEREEQAPQCANGHCPRTPTSAGLQEPRAGGDLAGESEAGAAAAAMAAAVAADSPLAGRSDFRTKFLQKLADRKVLVPEGERGPRHQSVIIFDWDDTLLCTSWLTRRKGSPMSPAVEECLQKLAEDVQNILTAAMQMGQTFIITNAMEGWVEHSAAKWMPQLLPTLRKVRVISARDRYEPQYPTEVDMWKKEAFLAVQRQLDSTKVTNLIALGDSDFEMKAAHVMGKQFEHALLKTVKFRTMPTPAEMVKQVELVSQNFSKIVSTVRNIKIVLERRSY